MSAMDRYGFNFRSLRRQLLWWISPSSPTSWSSRRASLQPAAAQISRLTVAAVLAYLATKALSPGVVDLTAPLTALLVVQASTVGTLRMGLVRVGAVLTGVLVAVVLASFFGLSWWSLATVIASSLVLAKVLRLGEQSLEAPISAMLILAVSSPELAAQVRVVNTLIGTAVGIGFSLVAPVSIRNAAASDAVRRVARSQAALLDEVAITLGDRAPHQEESTAWFDWIAHISGDIADAFASVTAVEESRRLNPRALVAAKVHVGLRSALERLERALAAERAFLVVIAGEAPPEGGGGDNAELHRAFSVLLDDLANGLRSFGDVITAEYGTGSIDHVDEAMGRALDFVRETRAVLADLMMIVVGPEQRSGAWLLSGSILAAVDHLVQQLDFDRTDDSG